MKTSEHKSYDNLPLFLNVAMVVTVLGVSPSNGYEFMQKADLPILKVGSRIAVPKEKFIRCLGNTPRKTGNDHSAEKLFPNANHPPKGRTCLQWQPALKFGPLFCATVFKDKPSP